MRIDLLNKIMSVNELFTHFSNLMKDQYARVIPADDSEILSEIHSCQRYCRVRLNTAELPDDKDYFAGQLAEIDALLACYSPNGWSRLLNAYSS
jgi:hypothetical protein